MPNTPSHLPKKPQFGLSGPQAASSSSSTPQEDQRVIDFRNATNFRSVTRNDPTVEEILETSVYSVIYQYDEVAGEWEKQKQEGPLFVVKRSKAPEYALFMLNRQTVKNVLIPLVPGEIKCTVVDSSTLQVARRGEKQRRGVWFSDGQVDVIKFRDTIVRICGEPVKKQPSPSIASAIPLNNSSPGSIPPPPVPTSKPTNAPLPADDFSRLFAGLSVANLWGRSVSDTSAIPRQHAQATGMTPPSDPARLTRQTVDNDIVTAKAPQYYAVTPQPDPLPVPTSADLPTGQSAEDLLNSLLGLPRSQPMPSAPPLVSPPPQPPAPQSSGHPVVLQGQVPPPPLPEPSHLQNSVTASDLLSQWAPPPSGQNAIVSPDLRKKSSKVGEATFAQAAAVPPPPPPPPPLPPQGPLETSLNGHQIPSRDPLREALMFNVGHMQPGVRSKGELIDQVMWLLHNDERFVDNLWWSYLERTKSGPG
ncbi:hypothetical protein BD324DRAFT_637747 [Kockovaella imperatae]|uniref:Dcp1-like decapping family-domain-containing protein n=1 Tax=Kockovaella imperatae TaxID=4999 RepID=A0A1Y1U8W9_9TREE|nr:hypothetical protein BD324DRAFT_637747 [Kockovaella imperatae]ORX33937.1 hypothetical protein BD324DRAFT_637747 [Kockovaella imperatae]